MPAFRKATERDAAAIAALEGKYIECAWSERVVRQTIADEDSVLLLLTDGDALCGYGGLKMIADTAEVYNIVVDEPYRRRGYGGQILEALIGYAAEHGAQEMLIEVNAHNMAARNLYDKYGFTVLYTRKHYYKSGDALVLKRKI